MPLVFPVDAEAADFDAGPCAPWDPIWCCDLTDASNDLQSQMVAAATEVLWARSGRQFGLCRITGARPCRRDCWPGSPDGAWLTPVHFERGWVNVTCGGGCGSGCSCSSVEEAELPGPVNRVIEVRVDGGVVPTGSYRVDDHRLLVRTDGAMWPLCQDLNAAAGEPGTWEVTYDIGLPVGELGRAAVGELACALINACTGQSCGLSLDVADLVRQGVSTRKASIEVLIASKLIGLPISDLFIRTYNPNGLDSPSGVYSPDLPAMRVPGG